MTKVSGESRGVDRLNQIFGNPAFGYKGHVLIATATYKTDQRLPTEVAALVFIAVAFPRLAIAKMSHPGDRSRGTLRNFVAYPLLQSIFEILSVG
jgi:hypothetical protein